MADSPSVLERRTQGLVRDLLVTRERLGRIDPALGGRVELRINTRIATAITQAEAIRADARLAGDDPAGAWAGWHATRQDVEDLLEECQVLLAGAATREAGLDDGWCAIADALVDELVARTTIGHWGSFTVPARAEQYSRASRVIEVRSPATSWELPAVAHELGHLVGPALSVDEGLSTRHPIDALFEDLGDGSGRSWNWINELCADVFAAHVLGPAYGWSCALDIFDPLLALVETETHPPAEQRMRAIAAVLAASRVHEVRWHADALLQQWHELVAQSGGADGRAPLDDSPYAAALVALITTELPLSAWCDVEAEAATSRRLLAGERVGDVGGPTPRATVLNAAWTARRASDAPTQIDDIGHRVLDWLKGGP